MNRALSIAACGVVIGIVIVCLVLLEDRNRAVVMERSDKNAPGEPVEDQHCGRNALEREPLETGMPPAADNARAGSDRAEPAPPDSIRSKSAGWWIWGFVREPNYKPIAGARVTLSLSCESFYREIDWPLSPVRTDPSGRYAVRFENPFGPPRLAPSGLIPLALRGNAHAPGYVQAHWAGDEFLVDVAQEHFAFRFDFLHTKGGTLHGRVVDSKGVPAGDATVRVCDPTTGLRVAEGNTDASGQYAIGLWVAGRNVQSPPPGEYAIFAAKLGCGLSLPAAVTIVADDDVEGPLLTLLDHGVIAGTVERPDGSPVADVEVLAFPRDWTEEGDHEAGGYSTGFPGHRKARVDLASIESGHTFGLTRTGRDGTFRLAGLRRGAYTLQIPWDHQSAESEEDELDDLFVPCTTGDLSLQIAICHYELRVLLLDESGRRVPRAELFCTSGAYESGEGSAVVGGEAVLLISPGPLRVQAKTGTGLLARHESVVACGSYRSEVRLELRKQRRGRLCLAITYHDGRIVAPETPLSIIGRSNNDFFLLDDRQIGWDDKGQAVVDLVSDRYDLTISEAVLHRASLPPTSLPAEIKDVFVKEGAEIELPVILKPAGQLRLTLHCDRPAPRPWKIDLEVWCTNGSGTRSHSLRRFIQPSGHSAISCRFLKPGIAYLSDKALLPGSYRLEVEAEGFEAAEAFFSIVADEVTELEVWLTGK